MADSENTCICTDVTPELKAIIEELQKANEHLEEQTAIQQEQINGFTMIVNYQFATLAIIVLFVVIAFVWKVFNGWFFKGV